MQAYGGFQLYQSSKMVLPASNPVPAAAFVVCTTCHTPHTMYTYKASTSTGGKVGLGGGVYDTANVYPTYWFISAPYNPGAAPAVNQASSATQFCRQCHFSGAGGSNEASGISGVTTKY
jgi:cytochrome c553